MYNSSNESKVTRHLQQLIRRRFVRPGRFPGIAGKAGNHGNNRKYHKSDQTLSQTKGGVDKLRLGKI